VVVGSRRHYRFRRPLSLDQFVTLPHILVSPRGDLKGIVDSVLAREGRERRVIAAVPLFFPALAAVRDSKAIATLPRRIGEAYADAFGLSVTRPPVIVRRFTIAAVRHRRNASNPFHIWLTETIRQIGQGAPRGVADPVSRPPSRRPAAR
jgi:DNA-binding transcriptional LysR family regulator